VKGSGSGSGIGSGSGSGSGKANGESIGERKDASKGKGKGKQQQEQWPKQVQLYSRSLTSIRAGVEVAERWQLVLLCEVGAHGRDGGAHL
jgi:hypothetical protein